MGAAVSLPGARKTFCSKRLESVFQTCFFRDYRTRLQGGAEEPIYRPAAGTDPAQLCYREDYFASALHEVAHWCIAGEQRRQQVDFGYWYAPEGRNEQQQRAFERVECQPQALEWFFSMACGSGFRLSADNLDAATGAIPANNAFARQVLEQALHWQCRGLPPRAQVFYAALCIEFDYEVPAADLVFELADICQ